MSVKIVYVGYNPDKSTGFKVTSYECDGVAQPLPPVCEWRQIFLAIGPTGERVVSREEAQKILSKKAS